MPPWWEQLHTPAGRWGYAWMCTCGAKSKRAAETFDSVGFERHVEREKKKHQASVKSRRGKRQHERAPYRLWRQPNGTYRPYPSR